jgi:hypothetical protein
MSAAAAIEALLQGSRLILRSARQVPLSRVVCALDWCAQGVGHGVARAVASGKLDALEWYPDPDAGSGVALVGQGRQSRGCASVEGGQNMSAGHGDVANGTGFDLAGPDRIPLGSATTCMFPPCCLCLSDNHRSCPASDGELQRVDGRPRFARVPARTAGTRTVCAGVRLMSRKPSPIVLIRGRRLRLLGGPENYRRGPHATARLALRGASVTGSAQARRGWRSSNGSPTTTPADATARWATSPRWSSHSIITRQLNSHSRHEPLCPYSGGHLNGRTAHEKRLVTARPVGPVPGWAGRCRFGRSQGAADQAGRRGRPAPLVAARADGAVMSGGPFTARRGCRD